MIKIIIASTSYSAMKIKCKIVRRVSGSYKVEAVMLFSVIVIDLVCMETHKDGINISNNS